MWNGEKQQTAEDSWGWEGLQRVEEGAAARPPYLPGDGGWALAEC